MVVTDRSARASAAIKRLPPFPAIGARVVELLASELTSFYDVAELLETDAALTAEVLRLANSPLTSVRSEISNVVQGIAILGSRRVAALIMTLSLSKLMRRAGGSEALRRLWRHNLACALAARSLAEIQHRDSTQAYYAGLFHDVGRLALLAQQPSLYDQALLSGDDIDEMERRHFGIDHCEAGAWVIEQWKLPEAFVEVALRHHNPGQDCSDLTLMVSLASQIADRLGFSLIPVEGPAELGPADEVGFSIALAVNSLEAEFGI